MMRRGCLPAIAVLALMMLAVLAYSQPISDRVNDFGFALFKQSVGSKTDANAFMSPYSVAVALTVTYNGAGGVTATEMANVLRLKGMPVAEVNTAHKELIDTMSRTPGRGGAQFKTANSLWAGKGEKFQPSFLEIGNQFYGAGSYSVDFGQKATVDRINKWIEDGTNGKIKGMLSPAELSGTSLLLLNTVYFKCSWMTPFAENLTKDGTFHAAGKAVTAKMMNVTGLFGHAKTAQFEAARLPYSDRRYAMYIFVPSESLGLKGFLKGLDNSTFNKYVDGIKSGDGTIVMPKFKFESSNYLNAPLKAMGMKSAFGPGANFRNMAVGGAGLFISYVKHNTYVAVDEKGTEAAAATAVAMTRSARIPQNPFTMVIDRPFFFAIRDDSTNTVLFTGIIADPTKGK